MSKFNLFKWCASTVRAMNPRMNIEKNELDLQAARAEQQITLYATQGWQAVWLDEMVSAGTSPDDAKAGLSLLCASGYGPLLEAYFRDLIESKRAAIAKWKRVSDDFGRVRRRALVLGVVFACVSVGGSAVGAAKRVDQFITDHRPQVEVPWCADPSGP